MGFDSEDEDLSGFYFSREREGDGRGVMRKGIKETCLKGLKAVFGCRGTC